MRFSNKPWFSIFFLAIVAVRRFSDQPGEHSESDFAPPQRSIQVHRLSELLGHFRWRRRFRKVDFWSKRTFAREWRIAGSRLSKTREGHLQFCHTDDVARRVRIHVGLSADVCRSERMPEPRKRVRQSFRSEDVVRQRIRRSFRIQFHRFYSVSANSEACYTR